MIRRENVAPILLFVVLALWFVLGLTWPEFAEVQKIMFGSVCVGDPGSRS